MRHNNLAVILACAISTSLLATTLWSAQAAADLTTSLSVEEKVAFRRKSIRVMKEQFELATVAAKAQDYAIARDNFFVPGRRIWFMFGGTVKRQGPALYEPLQSRLNRINTALGQSRPSQTALISDLQEVNRLMQQAVTTSDANL